MDDPRTPPTPDPDEWRPTGRKELVFRKVGDEWLLFDPRAQEVHVLNLSAAVVWSHCTGDHTVREIVRATRDAFGEAPEPLGDRVREIVRRFRESGLLEGATGDG